MSPGRQIALLYTGFQFSISHTSDGTDAPYFNQFNCLHRHLTKQVSGLFWWWKTNIKWYVYVLKFLLNSSTYRLLYPISSDLSFHPPSLPPSMSIGKLMTMTSFQKIMIQLIKKGRRQSEREDWTKSHSVISRSFTGLSKYWIPWSRGGIKLIGGASQIQVARPEGCFRVCRWFPISHNFSSCL